MTDLIEYLAMSNKFEISLGVVGMSEGNGHPFSFSSIINGYESDGYKKSKWDVIHSYLRTRDESEFGFPGVEVTHGWTQNTDTTEILCQASNIPHPSSDLSELIESVDAILLARDDFESRRRIAHRILETDKPLFIDKPLATNLADLNKFVPYLASGKLMSCSGFRYARELDILRNSLNRRGTLQLINGVVVNDWERYGVHLVDAVLNTISSEVVAVSPHDAGHDSLNLLLSDDSVFNIDMISNEKNLFQLSFYTDKEHFFVELQDNFTAFRRLLFHFLRQVKTGQPSIPPVDTINVVKIIIAGRLSLKKDKKIYIDELNY